ncbi:Cytochrome p450 86a2, partial [Globisporangium polare]
VAATVVIGALVLLVAAKLIDYKDPLSRLPRPKSTLPFLGNTIATLMYRHRFYDWHLENSELFQGPWRMHILGRGPSIVIASPELFEDVLKTQFDCFPKDEGMCQIFRDFFGRGIFAVNGEEWRSHRHTASNLFSFQMLKRVMHAVVKEKAKTLGDVLAEYAAAKRTVSLKTVLNHFTCDVFAKVGFGVERRALEGDLHGKPINDFSSAAVTISRVMYLRFLTPTWFWKLKRHFNVSDERQLKKSIEFIDGIAYKIINKSILEKHRFRHEAVAKALDDHVNDRRSELAPPTRDLISMFMESNALAGGASPDTEEMDAKVIRDMVVSFIAAGTDTTCQSMLSFVMMMNRYPRVLKKVRNELRAKLPGLQQQENAELPSMTDLSCLIYLEAVIRENLRLNPAVPVTTRSANVDTTLSDGTFVPKGTRVVLSIYSLMRSKSVWGDDALEFKPERWINPSTGALITVSPFKFPAFLAGPRVCLGKKLAKIELKMMLAVVLSRFDLKTLDDPWQMTYQTGLTASVKGPMLIQV